MEEFALVIGFIVLPRISEDLSVLVVYLTGVGDVQVVIFLGCL